MYSFMKRSNREEKILNSTQDVYPCFHFNTLLNFDAEQLSSELIPVQYATCDTVCWCEKYC